jgi:glycosyltransferase involved in cell wall biosynthesis
LSRAPLVSFLMPVYNAGRTVERALRSVLGQRDIERSAVEYVVVDDGSTDSTFEILSSLAARDSRLHLIRLPHQGLVPALIEGQAFCRGEFLARMDSDDIALPDRLNAQLELIRSDPGLGLVGAKVRYFPRKRVRAGLIHYESWLNSLFEGANTSEVNEKIQREIFVECPLAHPTFLIRREAFEQAGQYRDHRNRPEDYDLILRISAAGWRLGGVGRVLHLWREHGGRASRNESRYGEESFRSLKLDYLSEMWLDGGRKPVSICGAGPVGKAWLKELQAAGIEVRYLIEVNPRKIGKRIHGVQVVRAGQLRELGEPGLILGAVGQKGARESIRADLDPLGFEEGRDYFFVA